MICITCTTVTYNLRINLCTTCFCMLKFFQYHDTGTFTHYKTASVLIKRNGTSCGIFAGRKCCQCCKSGNTDRSHTTLCTTCYHYLSLTILNCTESFTNRVCTGSTCSYYVDTLTFQTKLNGHISCCHVTDHHGNQQRIYSGRAFFQQLAVFSFHCLQGTNTGTYGHTYTEGIFFFHIKCCIFQSFSGRCYCILTEQFHTLCSLRIHIILGIKILDLCC